MLRQLLSFFVLSAAIASPIVPLDPVAQGTLSSEVLLEDLQSLEKSALQEDLVATMSAGEKEVLNLILKETPLGELVLLKKEAHGEPKVLYDAVVAGLIHVVDVVLQYADFRGQGSLRLLKAADDHNHFQIADMLLSDGLKRGLDINRWVFELGTKGRKVPCSTLLGVCCHLLGICCHLLGICYHMLGIRHHLLGICCHLLGAPPLRSECALCDAH